MRCTYVLGGGQGNAKAFIVRFEKEYAIVLTEHKDFVQVPYAYLHAEIPKESASLPETQSLAPLPPRPKPSKTKSRSARAA